MTDYTELAEETRLKQAKENPSQSFVPRDGTRFDNHRQVMRVDLSDRTMSSIALAVACMAIIAAVWAGQRAERAEKRADQSSTEARIIQQHMMDNNALLVRMGVLLPSDTDHGPAGNLQYVRKDVQQP